MIAFSGHRAGSRRAALGRLSSLLRFAGSKRLPLRFTDANDRVHQINLNRNEAVLCPGNESC
jgi:hypothetical protein